MIDESIKICVLTHLLKITDSVCFIRIIEPSVGLEGCMSGKKRKEFHQMSWGDGDSLSPSQ